MLFLLIVLFIPLAIYILFSLILSKMSMKFRKKKKKIDLLKLDRVSHTGLMLYLNDIEVHPKIHKKFHQTWSEEFSDKHSSIVEFYYKKIFIYRCVHMSARMRA